MFKEKLEAPIALLIDGDNISPDFAGKVLGIAQQYGTVVIKRVYADFSLPQHFNWKNCILEKGMKAIHTFSYTKGKNTTDIALVIDAMDLMCAKKAEVFCIASSDSDFTQLAVRLQENGIKVIGLGKFCTNNAFVKACSKFHFIDNVSNGKSIEVDNTCEENATNLEVPENISEAPFPEETKDNTTPLNALDAPANKTDAPQLPGLKLVGKVDLSDMDLRTGKRLKPTNKIEDNPQPDMATFIPTFSATFLNQFHQIFKRVADPVTNIALLSRLSEALKAKMNFSCHHHGVRNFQQFCKLLSPYYELVSHSDNCTYSLKFVSW